MPTNCFNIRIYALFVNDNHEILIADEYFKDTKMIKFPGGGLEFGESHQECLIREAIEEMDQPIEVGEHFYTTDFFQQAMFYKDVQVVSVYYWAKLIGEHKFVESKTPFEKTPEINGSYSFRWLKISELTSEMFTFKIDQEVASKLIEHFKS